MLINSPLQGCDQTFGKILAVTSVSALTYYFFWILILPGLPNESQKSLAWLFPLDSMVGIVVSVVCGTIFFTGLSIYAFILLNTTKEE